MSGRLQNEIRQGKPFASIEVEASLNLVRTSEALRRGVHELLKPQALTEAAYNVLRILRGAGEQGRTCGEIAARLVVHDPDVTRLLDRLEQRELVVRDRSATDRRVVVARLTEAGRALCTALEVPLDDLHRRQLAHLGPDRLAQLIALLEDIRSHLTPPEPNPEQP
ncbi:MarR family transcriptional regulator [Planctomycetota bacterium]|nr:MarR family transcriptional regulator [Planctomycetota bacterium]